MTDTDHAGAPDSLPKYLAEGVPKQDTETLEELAKYVDALLEHRRRSVDIDELPTDADPVDQDTDRKGALVKERVKCGNENCKCASGNEGDMHGPYLYRYYRENGSLTSEYEGKA